MSIEKFKTLPAETLATGYDVLFPGSRYSLIGTRRALPAPPSGMACTCNYPAGRRHFWTDVYQFLNQKKRHEY